MILNYVSTTVFFLQIEHYVKSDSSVRIEPDKMYYQVNQW